MATRPKTFVGPGGAPDQRSIARIIAAVSRVAAVAILVLLAAFIAYPLLTVLAVAVTSPDGLTPAHLAGFFQRALFRERAGWAEPYRLE